MYTAKQMIIIRRDLKMRKGKIAAQAGHACVEAVLKAMVKQGRMQDAYVDENGMIALHETDRMATPLSDWFRNGVAKICVYVDGEQALLDLDRRAQEKGIVTALICDAGMTEFHGEATYTCLAFEPCEPERVAELTGSLPLY